MLARKKSSLERAYELADSGRYFTLAEIQMKLKSEGLDPNQVEGFALRHQLLAIIRAATERTILKMAADSDS